jgi:hypothetical protein
MRSKILSIVGLVLMGILVSCDAEDASEENDKALCEEVGKSICQAACQCTPGDACEIANEGEASTSSFVYNNETECQNEYVDLNCSGTIGSSMDFEKCQEALPSAQCVDQEDGKVYEKPLACNE